eukprot:SAG31_NODE_101_length_25195_cov_67.436758_10_plen_437_part_00
MGSKPSKGTSTAQSPVAGHNIATAAAAESSPKSAQAHLQPPKDADAPSSSCITQERQPVLSEINGNVRMEPSAGSASESMQGSNGDFGFLAMLAGGKSGGNTTPPSLHDKQSSWSDASTPVSKKSTIPSSETRGITGTSTCTPGCATDLGGRKENQDTFFSVILQPNGPDGPKIWAGAVFDGHGREGKAAAQYARDRVWQTLEQQSSALLRSNCQEVENVLRTAFSASHSGMGMYADCSYSGTTATVCVLLPPQNSSGSTRVGICSRLVTAWVGDSRAIIGYHSNHGVSDISVVQLTVDHRPEEPAERCMIEAAGGIVLHGRNDDPSAPLRVYGKDRSLGLMLTRSLGDLEMHSTAGVSAEPQMSWRDITAEDKLLVLGSDGVYDVLSDEQVAAVALTSSNATAAATNIVKEAASKWRVQPGSDNVTAIVLLELSL